MANLGYLQVTRECNQRCRFCSNPPSGQAADLPALAAQADDLAARGCTGIILTGGEPTLHPDLPDLVAHITARGLPARIITNGRRLARGDLLARLVAAGLSHVHLSAYSFRPAVQDDLTQTSDASLLLSEALERLGDQAARNPGFTVDLNVVMSRGNADHLHEVAAHVVAALPFVHHVVWNNLDPSTDRVAEHPETVPTLAELEVPLLRALTLLYAAGRTFRVERVPLCYLPGFEHVSTETRKLVKQEPRYVQFLDDKRLVCQQGRAGWERGKAPVCQVCRLSPLCAGLDSLDRYYASSELSPVFTDPEPIAQRILAQP